MDQNRRFKRVSCERWIKTVVLNACCAKVGFFWTDRRLVFRNLRKKRHRRTLRAVLWKRLDTNRTKYHELLDRKNTDSVQAAAMATETFLPNPQFSLSPNSWKFVKFVSNPRSPLSMSFRIRNLIERSCAGGTHLLTYIRDGYITRTWLRRQPVHLLLRRCCIFCSRFRRRSGTATES